MTAKPISAGPMRHVQKVKGRDGVVRLYFRKAGHPSVRLNAAEGTPELEAEVAALAAVAVAKPLPGTLRAAIRAYELESADFAGLAASTKVLYRLSMAELDTDFGALPVATFRPAYLLKLRNLWASRGYRAANIRMQVLKNVLWPSVIAGQLGEGDPFAMIPSVRRPHDTVEPHLIWTRDVLKTVIDAAIAENRLGLARGVALGRYTGARRADIVRMTENARRGGRVRYVTGKRKVEVDMPEAAALTAQLAATPRHKSSLIIAYNMDGHAYTANGFALELRKLIEKLHKDGKLDSADYGVHGLRHTFGVEAALAGCTDPQGAALLGHASPNSFATYRRQADRIRMANDASDKIAQLREQTEGADLKNNVENNCKTAAPSDAR